jgi:hypothetical protein
VKLVPEGQREAAPVQKGRRDFSLGRWPDGLPATDDVRHCAASSKQGQDRQRLQQNPEPMQGPIASVGAHDLNVS